MFGVDEKHTEEDKTESEHLGGVWIEKSPLSVVIHTPELSPHQHMSQTLDSTELSKLSFFIDLLHHLHPVPCLSTLHAWSHLGIATLAL